MEALGKEAKNFGAIVTSEMKDKAGEADDAFKRLDATMLGLKRTLAVEMAPALTDTLGAFTQLVALASKLNLSMLTLANPTTGAIAMLANQMKGLEILFRGLNEGKTLKQINQELIDARNKKLDKIPGINAPEPIDLGGPQAKVDFKQHTNKPADIFSREGFHMLASAIQPAAVNIDEKQLVELKGINKGVGKVQNRLEKLQIPGVGPKI
jgi:hypothetical protein